MGGKLHKVVKIAQAQSTQQILSPSTGKDSQQSKSKASPANQNTYVVKPGDSLSTIAGKLYGNYSLWPLLFSANKDKIKDPNVISPGWTLKVPSKRKLSPQDTQNIPQLQPARKKIQPTTNVVEQAKQMGLVSLDGIGEVKNNPYAVPELAQVAKEMRQYPGVKKLRITEAWPPVSNHVDRNHFNGRALDITIHDWPSPPTRKDFQTADALTKYLKSKGFDVLNEYRYDTRYKTGVHIHIDMGSMPSVADKVASDKSKLKK